MVRLGMLSLYALLPAWLAALGVLGASDADQNLFTRQQDIVRLSCLERLAPIDGEDGILDGAWLIRIGHLG